MKSKKYSKGFSIVELMVALLLGLFLVSGVAAMYISSKQSYRVTDNLSRLQESMRFSLELMAQDVRMAGYMPCRRSADARNLVTGGESGANAWFLDFFNFGIRGYENSTNTPANNVLANTDAVVILKGGFYSSSVATQIDSSSTINLQESIPDGQFAQGDIAIICDPRKASIFQISARTKGNSSTGGSVSYSASSNTIIPGNNSNDMGTYGSDAQITSFEPVMYFIRPSGQTPNVNSLWRRYFTSGSTGTAQMITEELLEGIDSMQILYGVDSVLPNNQVVDRYVKADGVTDWEDVISVRIGLLMSTGEEVAAQIDTNTYNVAGTLIADTATTPTHPADRKLRYVTNTTINLRNRVQ